MVSIIISYNFSLWLSYASRRHVRQTGVLKSRTVSIMNLALAPKTYKTYNDICLFPVCRQERFPILVSYKYSVLTQRQILITSLGPSIAACLLAGDPAGRVSNDFVELIADCQPSSLTGAVFSPTMDWRNVTWLGGRKYGSTVLNAACCGTVWRTVKWVSNDFIWFWIHVFSGQT